MEVCLRCQSHIVSFYLFKLRVHKAQDGFKLPDNKAECETDTDQPLVLHTLDIVKNFIDKHSVQSIFEDQVEQRLVIERHASSAVTVKEEAREEEHETTISESKVSFVSQEDSNDAEFGDYDVLDDPIEQVDESTTSDVENFESIDEEVKESTSMVPILEDTAETERFMLDNIEFIDRTPEYIVNAYKPSEKASRPKDPDNWIRNKQRRARARGEEYVTNSGKKIAAKRLQSPCKMSCRFKCRRKISEEDRQKNFDKYWNLASFILQRKFIFEHHKTVPVQRRRFRSVEGGKPRQYSSQYFLDKYNINGTTEQVQVCESMFLRTFDICRNIVAYLHKKVQTGKVQDLRGINRRKLSSGHEAAIEQIKANPFYHIEQPMPITKMFELYQQECLDRGIEPVKNHTYRKLFAEYNECEFLKRDKIICELCDRYYRASDDEKNILNAKYNEHIQTHEKCMQRAKGRDRAARKVASRMKPDTDDLIVEEHLSNENEEMEYE